MYDLPQVVMVGGPNGAGKTTAAKELLFDRYGIVKYLDVDQIAQSLPGQDLEHNNALAARRVLDEIKELTHTRQSFAFETTCSSLNYMSTLRNCMQAGYESTLLFFWLPSADIAIRRVNNRIKQGGHPVPEEVIQRRYINGLRNAICAYMPIVENATIIDGSALSAIDASLQQSAKIIATKEDYGDTQIHHPRIWEQINAVIDESAATIKLPLDLRQHLGGSSKSGKSGNSMSPTNPNKPHRLAQRQNLGSPSGGN